LYFSQSLITPKKRKSLFNLDLSNLANEIIYYFKSDNICILILSTLLEQRLNVLTLYEAQ